MKMKRMMQQYRVIFRRGKGFADQWIPMNVLLISDDVQCFLYDTL